MGETINSHISGPLKEPMLIIGTFVVLFFLQLGVFLLIRIRRNKGERLESVQEKAYFWMLVGFALSKAFYIIGDYYVDESFRRIIYHIAYLIQWIGVFGFNYLIERNKKFLKKYIFSSMSFILIVVFIFIIFFIPDFVFTYSLLFYFTFLIFFVIYVKIGIIDFYKKNAIGKYNVQLITFITGGIMMISGFTLSSDVFISMFGLLIHVLGDVFEIIGFSFLYLFFLNSPSFSEYDWQDKIDSLFLTYKSGLVLYSKNFKGTEEKIDHSVVGGSITSVKLFLQKITEIQGDSVIEKEGKIVIIHPYDNIIGVLICDEKLKSLQTLLNNFTKKVGTIYRKILEDWDGDLNIFRPIENIVQEIFY